MRISLSISVAALLLSACSNMVTSPIAEQVTLYKDESAVPVHCESLGEVTASACANESPCPDEVMKKNIREKAFTVYNADAVWLFNTTLSGTKVVGYGMAYSCKK